MIQEEHLIHHSPYHIIFYNKIHKARFK